jgi:hypothetical protein
MGSRSLNQVSRSGALPCLYALAAMLGCGATEEVDRALNETGARPQDAVAWPLSSVPRSQTLFEAGAVRPVAVLESGLVAVTNIPNDRIELFRPHGKGSDTLRFDRGRYAPGRRERGGRQAVGRQPSFG